ncbi:MAG: M20/M25/M40 family metallo-hydrolase [Gemmatimonadaceae bacterium]
MHRRCLICGDTCFRRRSARPSSPQPSERQRTQSRGPVSPWAIGACMLLSPMALATQQRPATEDSLHRAIFRELVEINTSPMDGDVSRASWAVQRRLAAAGYPRRDVQVIGPGAMCLNVVATLRGRDSAAKPILLMAHLDVVPARRADWKFDPFVLREDDGWFYGRGVLDNKAGASVLVANMIRWKRERCTPARDLVMVLTCGEETSAEGGIQWLLGNVPRLRHADYALNTDAGDVHESKNGTISFNVQAAEKAYASFALIARNPGGHSSLPRPDNAIYALASALTRVSAHTFPVMFNDVTRTAFARGAELESGQRADDMRAAGRGETSGAAIDRLSNVTHLASQLRTTCVATMLAGGHAEKALPQSATATVNCRIMPGVAVAEVERALRGLVADTSVTVKLSYPPVPSPPSPLREDVLPTIERLAQEFWRTTVVIPSMSAGATDGLHVRNIGVPVYGVSAIQMAPQDDRSHGLDERVPVQSLYVAREFWYQMVKTLASPPTRAM